MSKLQSADFAYTFDDFVLIPQYSKIKSRKDPDISINIKGFNYSIPIISSPMNTVTEEDMIITMAELGGFGVLHRYMTVDEQVRIAKYSLLRTKYDRSNPSFYVAVGANGDFKDRVTKLHKIGITGFCVDVANGHNEKSIQAVQSIKRMVPESLVMAGNVVTYDGAYRLAEAGANSIRVGIGSGSLCLTRQVTGHGLPQLSAIEDCARIKCQNSKQKAFPNVAIIADGGIRKSGDIVKCIAIGADAVILGSLLSGTREAPGEIIEENGRLYKYYQGMASNEARSKYKGQSTGVPEEGVSKKVLYTGKVAHKVVEKLCKATKVGLSFSGANNIDELRINAKWRRVTNAGYVEGTPHGIPSNNEL
jgi:IMP dehydrogenase